VTLVRREERGAALVFAIVFMVVIGAISGATLSMLSSGLHDRVNLDVVRDRQYAADAGVEAAISAARPDVISWANDTYAAPPLTALQVFLNSAKCGGFHLSSRNNVNIRVDCRPAPALHAGYFQFNAIFSAYCTESRCSTTTPIVSAQVNFDISGGTVKRTYVQSWSVNA
jgi:Tfp pilus assembly protein PilX